MRNFSHNVAAYYAGARQRAKRRKSAWNLLLIPFCFGSWLAIWYGLFRAVWLFHIFIYPEHHLRDFWQTDITFWSFIPSFLMIFALMPGALIAGFMLGNSLLWLITPIRRILDIEAHDYTGTSFRDSMRGLYKLGVWVLPSGAAIALLAAYLLKSLR